MGAEAAIDAVQVASAWPVNEAAALFGESASRVVVSVAADLVTEVLQCAASRKVPAQVIGETGGNRLRVSVGGRPAVDVAVRDAESTWNGAIGRYFARRVA
jgi:phosphoribosylformylglycinamidine synthase